MQKVNTLRFVGVTLIAVAALLFQTTTYAAANSIEATVYRLYSSYSWIVVFATSSSKGLVPLSQASRRELSSVFVSDLAEAIFADAQCARESGEICAVDFDILFDSQDPSASNLTVEKVGHKEDTVVCFLDASNTRKCLTFVGVPTKGMVKIFDIVYPEQRSLRQLLGLSIKPGR